MVSEQDSNGICLQGDNTGTTMNASANSQEDNGICGSDSDSNPDDTTDYYQPISSVGNGGGGGGGDFSGQDPNSTFHQLPNGWTENGVSSLDTSDDDADEDVVKEIEEEEIHFWLGLFLIAHATRKLKRNSPISGVKMLRFLGKTTESRARSGGSIPTEVCGVGDEVLSAWELVNVSQSDDEDLYSYDSDEAASTGDSVSADNLEQVPAEEDDDDDDDVNVDEDAAPSPDFMTASDIITIQAISVSPAMNFPVGMQCNYVDLGTLESDLQAALVALKKKEEDLQDAERKVASEFNEINFARKDLEQLEVDYGGYVRSNSRRSCQETYGLFAGWNLIWNNALKSRPLSSSVQSNEILNSSILSFSSSPQVYEKSDETLDANKVDEYVEEREMEGSLAPYNNEFPPDCKESWVMDFNNEGTSCSPELQFGEKVDGAAKSEEAPHDAFKFCLMLLRMLPRSMVNVIQDHGIQAKRRWRSGILSGRIKLMAAAHRSQTRGTLLTVCPLIHLGWIYRLPSQPSRGGLSTWRSIRSNDEEYDDGVLLISTDCVSVDFLPMPILGSMVILGKIDCDLRLSYLCLY